MGQDARGISNKEKAALWEVLKGPLTLILYGIAGVIVVLAIKATGLFQDIAGFLTFGKSAERIATLVFLVGLGFAAFLWWLCARYFQLLRQAAPGENLLTSLKELPMALPEGTVRAIIALIIGVVGLPLLVFSKELGLSDAIAGYVNGIIIGVFSYYFGTRANAGDAQTTRQTVKMLDTAQATNAVLEQKVNELSGEVQQVDGLKTSLQASDFDRQTTRLQEQLTQAEVLIEVLGPALPKGLIPDGASDALKTAQQVLESARKLKAGEVTGETVTQLASAAESLIGKSPLTALLKTAAGALPALGSLTPAAGLALLLGVAWRLGSDQYRRWLARVLDAPYDPQLISLGLISGESAVQALDQSPIFKKAFAGEAKPPAFYNDLLDIVLRDDAADRLWVTYGARSECFASRGELEQGLNEFRGALIWDQSASDISPAQIRDAQAVLAGTPLAGGEPAPEQLNSALRAIAANRDVSDEQRSALQALVLLVGNLRQAKLDPLKLISEGWKS